MSKQPKTTLARPMKAWAGFTGGKIVMNEIDDGWGGFGQKRVNAPAVYMSRESACRCFRDVRPVLITEIPKTAKRKAK